MRVRSLVSWAGPLFEVHPGDIVDLPDAVAEARIRQGLAEPEVELVEVPVSNPPRRTRGTTEAHNG